MYLTHYNSNNWMWDENITYEYVADTFKAFADSMVPRSPELAEQYGRVQYYGALDLHTDEYLIMSLDSLVVPLAIPVAQALNTAAELFLYNKGGKQNHSSPSAWTSFLRLSPDERLQVIDLLIQPEGAAYFPTLMQMGGENIFSVVSSLNQLTMLGYYSEWSGYGSTRLAPPNQRVLEHRPVGWEQTGYPGPSRGYRVSRSYSYV